MKLHVAKKINFNFILDLMNAPNPSVCANKSATQPAMASNQNKELRRRPSAELIPDASVLNDLEAHARAIASGLDMALRDLRGSLRGMSDLTNESMQVFNGVVNSTCDQIDTAIRSTYAMLAKSEEFNESMRGVQKLFQQM